MAVQITGRAGITPQMGGAIVGVPPAAAVHAKVLRHDDQALIKKRKTVKAISAFQGLKTLK